ncbi:hypothetical protein COB72_09535 [bacterium]|nr:MAG: hypothetical protein COB72_09535 [bacterium]
MLFEYCRDDGLCLTITKSRTDGVLHNSTHHLSTHGIHRTRATTRLYKLLACTPHGASLVHASHHINAPQEALINWFVMQHMKKRLP